VTLRNSISAVAWKLQSQSILQWFQF